MLKFINDDNEQVIVISFEAGVATLEGYVGVSILSYLKKTLKMWSNLEKNIQDDHKTEESLEEIRTKLNGSEVFLKRGETAEAIYERWKKERIFIHQSKA